MPDGSKPLTLNPPALEAPSPLRRLLTAAPRLARQTLPIGLLGAALIWGAWAVVVRLDVGLAATWLTSVTPWGAWIAFYIFFVGLSAGAFLLSSLAYVFGHHELEAVTREALLVALLSMLTALGFVALDLGRPERLFDTLLYWNPTSVLAWEIRFYVLYVVLLATELVISLRAGPIPRARRWLKALGMVGIPLAIFGVRGGSGLLFAVLKARPLWNTGLYPVLFVVSALVSGTALLAVLYGLRPLLWKQPVDDRVLSGLGRLLLGFLAAEASLVFFEFLVAAYRGEPLEHEALRLMWVGPLAWLFWGIQVAGGLVVPAVLIGLWGRRPRVVVTAAALAVAGMLAGRFNIVLPQMLTPVMEGLPAGTYVPSGVEWGASAGLIAAAISAFWLTHVKLPAVREG